jgi:hypothetical protein
MGEQIVKTNMEGNKCMEEAICTYVNNNNKIILNSKIEDEKTR